MSPNSRFWPRRFEYGEQGIGFSSTPGCSYRIIGTPSFSRVLRSPFDGSWNPRGSGEWQGTSDSDFRVPMVRSESDRNRDKERVKEENLFPPLATHHSPLLL